jgi:hypothetical protein
VYQQLLVTERRVKYDDEVFVVHRSAEELIPQPVSQTGQNRTTVLKATYLPQQSSSFYQFPVL